MRKTQKAYAGYFRVSTEAQARSAAGLASQRKAVLNHISGKLIKEFKEVKSGTKDSPELKKAIAMHAYTGACLKN